MLKKQFKKRWIAGWIAVGLSTVITCGWAFWDIIENFHEGWYFDSLWIGAVETGPKLSKGANTW